MRAKNSKFDLKDLKLSSYKLYVFKLDSCITLNCVQCSSNVILIQLQTTEKLLRKSMSFCQEKGCVITKAESSDAKFKTISIAHHLQKYILKFIYAKVCKFIANSTK